jgi:hypothetical protein
LISKTQEKPRTSKFGAQMVNGGNCSSMKEEALLTSEITEHSMQLKMMKDKRLNLLLELERNNNSGRSFIPIRRKPRSLRDLIQISDFTVTDHSTLSLDFQ